MRQSSPRRPGGTVMICGYVISAGPKLGTLPRRQARVRIAVAVPGAPSGPATFVGGMTGPNIATRVGAAFARRRPASPPPDAQPEDAPPDAPRPAGPRPATEPLATELPATEPS